MDTLVKTKNPAIVTQSFEVDEKDLVTIERLYARAQQSMRSPHYMPNRLAMTCSRRNCSYWRQCEREWGGTVSET